MKRKYPRPRYLAQALHPSIDLADVGRQLHSEIAGKTAPCGQIVLGNTDHDGNVALHRLGDEEV